MLVLPLSVMSVLIATSRYYDFLHVLYFLVALGVVNLALIILGGYMIVRAIIRIHNYDRLIHEIKLKHSVIGKFLE